jgi:exopolyphosphatase/guanosine-5'-triphosphate,3'-diphosphate pyrophosphatase
MDNDGTEVVGFIDVGTNSIHLLVVKFVPGTFGLEIAQEREVIRLGRSLYSSGTIDSEAIDRSRLVMERFAGYARKHGADRVIAFATCAAREADNQQELLDALQVDGVEVTIIPGQEEARLIKLGVLGVVAPTENTLLIDIGGGSTEISISNGRNILFLDSLCIGAVRYAYSFPFDCMSPLKYEEYASYQRSVDLNSYHAVKSIRQIGFKKAIGSSGTFESLADACAALRGDGDGSYLDHAELIHLMKKLRSMPGDQRSKVPKINPNRADIIVAGGAIAEELMSLLGIERMEVCRRGLKEGMEVDYLANHGTVNLDVREASVKALAYRCQYDPDHAREVRKEALVLFDETKRLGLHKMDDGTRSLLGYAAVLHDIGEFISYTRHHVNSYNIVLNSGLLGFGSREIAAIALIVRFHHKKFPAKDDSLFAENGFTDTADLRKCIALLRMADAMDRHRSGLVRGAAMRIENGTAVLTLASDQDIGMEVWKLEELTPDFLEVFGMPLKIEAVHVDPPVISVTAPKPDELTNVKR